MVAFSLLFHFHQVFVKLKNLATKNEFMWDRDTFLNRYYMMQEMYQNFVDGENISAIAKVTFT